MFSKRVKLFQESPYPVEYHHLTTKYYEGLQASKDYSQPLWVTATNARDLQVLRRLCNKEMLFSSHSHRFACYFMHIAAGQFTYCTPADYKPRKTYADIKQYTVWLF